MIIRAARVHPKPFPHAIISNFLSQAEAEKLCRALLKQRFQRKESDLFHFSQTLDLTHSQDKTIKAFITTMTHPNMLGWLRKNMDVMLNGEIDAMGVVYKDTDYLLCHDDELEDRKVAYILNLSTDFTKRDGGALALLDADKHHRPQRVVKRITPTWNTLTVFKVSRDSHHMVEEVLTKKDRLTIGGWFHG